MTHRSPLFAVALLAACNLQPSSSSNDAERAPTTTGPAAGSPVRTPVKTGTRLANFSRPDTAPIAQRAGGAVPATRSFALTPGADNTVNQVLEDGTTVTGTYDQATGAMDLTMTSPDGAVSHVVGTLNESPDGSSTASYTVDTTAPDGSAGHWTVTQEHTVAADATTTITHATGHLADGRAGAYDVEYAATEVIHADGSSMIDETVDDTSTAASPDQTVHAVVAADGTSTVTFTDTDPDGAAHTCTLHGSASGAISDAVCDGQPVDPCAFDGACSAQPGGTEPQVQDCSALPALPALLAPIEAGFQLGQAGDFPPGYDRVLMLVDDAHDGLFAALVPTGADLTAGATIPLSPVSWQGGTAPAAGFFLATAPCEQGRFVDGGTLTLRSVDGAAGRRLMGSVDYVLDGAPGTFVFDVPVAAWSGDAAVTARP